MGVRCARLKDCDALCLFVFNDFEGHKVLAGPIAENISEIRLTRRDGVEEAFRLTEPPRPQLAGRRIFMAPYDGAYFPRLEGFDPSGKRVATCIALSLCAPNERTDHVATMAAWQRSSVPTP